MGSDDFKSTSTSSSQKMKHTPRCEFSDHEDIEDLEELLGDRQNNSSSRTSTDSGDEVVVIRSNFDERALIVRVAM